MQLDMNALTILLAASVLVPKENPEIQAAINAAKPGETVLVSAGTYHGALKLKPGVILKSAGDDTRGKTGLLRAETTILEGGVEMAEKAMLDGFTVTGVGSYDEKAWQHHFDTQGNEQSHEHIGVPGKPGISAAVNCSVLNNIVHHIGYTGIAITGGSPRIAGNVCYRNMGGGIGSMKGSTALIEDNTCYENFYAGIGCDDSSPRIKNNNCHDNIRAGIGISEGSSPVVTGNRCFHNRRAGIGIRTGETTRPVVEDNECRDNQMAGIGIEERAQPTVKKNRVINNKLVGISVVGGSRAILADNEIAREGGMPPIIVVLNNSQATITGNTIRGGGVAGILVRGTAEIHKNHFIRTGKPGGKAVWAHAGSEVNCTGNTATGWKEAVSIAKGAKVSEEGNKLLPDAGSKE